MIMSHVKCIGKSNYDIFPFKIETQTEDNLLLKLVVILS